MSIADRIGQRIRSLRQSKGLTQDDVVQRCRSSKPLVSKSLISQLENKNTDVGLRRLEAMARALEISLPDLVNEKLSTEYIISNAALDAFCEEDEINALEKASLKDLLDKGIVSFSTLKDWRDHRRASKFVQSRRPTVADLHGRVAEAPQTYQVQGKTRGSHRKKNG